MADLRSGGLGVKGLAGSVAVITGGSSGIGAATARLLADHGVRIVVGYHQGVDRADAVVESLVGDGHRAMRLPVTDSSALHDAATEVEKLYGRCDILINSAGTTKKIAHSDLDGLDDDFFDDLLRTNVRGPFSVVRAFAPLLARSGDSVCINVSSLSAFSGSGSNIAYCAAKGALNTMTMSLARALAPEVRVIGVAPAAVDTDFVAGRDRAAVVAQAEQTPLRVLVGADDVAVAILGTITHFRISTGTTFVIDGGRHL